MKTKKFFKEIRSMGFQVEDFEESIIIIDSNNFFVAKVSKVKMGEISTDYPGFTNLDYISKLKLLYLLFKYTKTSVEDREDEEKYYYKLKGLNGPWNFLVKFKVGEPLSIGTYAVAKDREGTFTDAEFEALPEDIKSHNWEKIRVESDK